MSFASSDDYKPQGRKKKSTWMRSMAPLIGFLLIVAYLAIAVVLAQPVADALQTSLGVNLPADLRDIVVGGIIFFVLLMLTFMLYAMFVPKPKARVTEKELDRERNLKKAERIAAKRRKQEVARKMAQASRQKSEK